MSTALDFVLSKLGAKRSGASWKALCPAHDDRNPSLSIDERDGRILLYCWAGCSTEAVCAASGIEVRDLFTEPGASRKAEPGIVRTAQREIAGLRSRLTRADRERPVTVVYATRENLDAAFARAIALAVEGELVQVALARGAE
jgi:CHC2 zinc finger